MGSRGGEGTQICSVSFFFFLFFSGPMWTSYFSKFQMEGNCSIFKTKPALKRQLWVECHTARHFSPSGQCDLGQVTQPLCFSSSIDETGVIIAPFGLLGGWNEISCVQRLPRSTQEWASVVFPKVPSSGLGPRCPDVNPRAAVSPLLSVWRLSVLCCRGPGL